MTSTALSRRALPDGTLSRRTVLSTLGLTAGGTAALAAGMLPAPQAAAAPTSSAPGHRGPVAFVVGDSTASVYEQEIRPRAGWGQALPLLMGRGVTTFDYAWSGASSKSFFEAGKLDVVLDLMQPGDLLLISFGHNDSKIEDPDRGTDPDTTFKEYLTRYVEGARQQGGAPVLVTPVERRRFHADGTAGDSHGDYPRAMKELAEELEVPLVDLTASSRALWEGLGPEGTKGHFMHLEPGVHPQHPEGAEDNTHFQAVGALAVARLVAQGLVDQQVVSGSWFTRLEREIDAEAEIHWPAERTIDDALILTVGPGKAHSTVQDAVDAAPRGAGRRTIIAIDPGEHRAVVHVPSDVPRLTFLGMG
ncbi:GDSL-type esterase/lipase family protein [Nesterenkonia sp. K-15-9-6]|uniref:GDSL-type esterase/lipase family protein n=1 Tax=Nesterenkonia sp. K-15-9-6 TaxID=3093918 RepID=UPI004043A9DC